MGKGQMKKGFTIIETMLVLSISALFAVGLMIGWSVNINRQRYEDAVNTFKSDIQAVFNEVENPKNSAGQVSCTNRGPNLTLSTDLGASSQGKGTTNCIIMGKVIILAQVQQTGGMNHDSTEFITYTLIGDGSVDFSRVNDPLQAIRDANVSIDFNTQEVKQLEWGVRMRMVTDNTTDRFKSVDSGRDIRMPYTTGFQKTIQAVFLIRSPLDNSLYAFAGSSMISTARPGLDFLRINGRQPGGLQYSRFFDSGALLNNTNRTVDVCLRHPGSFGMLGGEAIYGRNKVVHIGSSGAEIAPLDGEGASSCGSSGEWSDSIIRGRVLNG